MKFAILPSKSPAVFRWRYETLEEAKQEAQKICLENNTTVEIFELITSFSPSAVELSMNPTAATVALLEVESTT